MQEYELQGPGRVDDRWRVDGLDSDEDTDVDGFVSESACSESSEDMGVFEEFVDETESSEQNE